MPDRSDGMSADEKGKKLVLLHQLGEGGEEVFHRNRVMFQSC